MLAKNERNLIYGGASIGLMGAVADAMLDNGRDVIGVMPEVINELEVAHEGLTELIHVKDMHERKKVMYEKADCFLVLPGGYGTLDELFEATWTQLGIHHRPVIVVNFNGFYDALKQHLKTMYEGGFIKQNHFELVTFADDLKQLQTLV